MSHIDDRVDSCPDRADWSAWTQGGLDPQTIVRLGTHLDRCPECLAIVEEVASSTGGGHDRESISGLLREAISGVDRGGPGLPSFVVETHRASLPHPNSEVTERIGKYVLLKQIGYGGFGVVYRAFDTQLGRTVALKLALPGAFENEVSRNRLLDEAKAAAKLDHPGIVTTLEAGEFNGRAYIVSNYCAGGSLETWLAQNSPVPIRLAASIVASLADAVEHAHCQGILHLDVKAANVLIDTNADDGNLDGFGGRPRLTDFGLARQIEATIKATSVAITQGGRNIGGTLTSMAREQVLGKKCLPSTDVYALGALLYRMIGNQHPLKGASDAATLRMILDDDPIPVRRLRPETPPDLESIAMKCLSKAPGSRYRTAGALANDLRQFLSGGRVTARRPGPISQGWRWIRKHPTVSATSALAVIGLLAIVIGLFLSNRRYAAMNRRLENRNYASELNRSYRAWEEGDLTQSRTILDGLIPKQPGDYDPRGFEWRFLRRLVAPDVADRTIKAHTKAAVGVAFSPDDTKMITCGLDGLVKLWDTRDYRLLKEFSGHDGDVNNVIFLGKDGKRAVSVGDDETVRIWDLEHLTPEQVLRGGKGRLYHVAASEDGNLLVAAGPKSGVVAWDTRTGQRVAHLAPDISITGLAVSPDGKHILAALAVAQTEKMIEGVPVESPLVKLWEIPEFIDAPWQKLPAKSIEMGHLYAHIDSLAISHDYVIATGGPDRTIRMIHGQDGSSSLPPWSGFRDLPGCLAFTPDGRFLAVGTRDGEVRLRSLGPVKAEESGSPHIDLVFHSSRGNIYRFSFTSDGRKLAVGSEDGTIQILDREALIRRTVAGPLARAIEPIPQIRGNLEIRPEGNRMILVPDEAAQIGLANRPWMDVVTAPSGGPFRAFCLAYSTKGNILAAGAVNEEAHLWDSQREVRRWEPGTASCAAIGFTPDREILVTASHTDGIQLWSVPDGRLIETLVDGHGLNWIDMAVSSDGRFAVAIAFHGEIAVFDLATRKLRVQVKGHTGECSAVTIAPDGSTFATAGHDKTVVIRDSETAEQIHMLSGHGEWVETLAYSPDGRTLVSGDAGGTLIFWQVETGYPLARFEHQHGGNGPAIAFTPDGNMLISHALHGYYGYANAWDGRDLP
ncbi:WD40 repeat domain-containing serine/threonine protein kinase [Tundrisphaera lichenicola]|uniref:WD40 repeat domain-containing serine/threonine protein kinase n=1 Tax=Tundrisphaera lichenicola TaxID=2029860 RepID=UPI003EBCB902